MTVVSHVRIRRPDWDRVELDSRFLGALSQSLYAGACPRDCCWAVAALLYVEAVSLPDKRLADVFVSWLRALCGQHFAELVSVQSKGAAS